HAARTARPTTDPSPRVRAHRQHRPSNVRSEIPEATMTKQSITTDNDDYVSQWVDRTRGPGFALVWLPVLMLSPILTAILDGDLAALTIHLAITVLYVVTILVAHSGLPQRVGELCTAGLMALVVIQFIVSLGGQGFLYPLLAIAAA